MPFRIVCNQGFCFGSLASAVSSRLMEQIPGVRVCLAAAGGTGSLTPLWAHSSCPVVPGACPCNALDKVGVALPPLNCLTLGNSLCISEPHFHHLPSQEQSRIRRLLGGGWRGSLQCAELCLRLSGISLLPAVFRQWWRAGT